MDYPNSESAKVIIQSGIREVVIMGKSPYITGVEREGLEVQAGRILLDMAGIKIRYCKPSIASLTLDFLSKLTPSSSLTEQPDENSPSTSDQMKYRLEDERVAKLIFLEEANYDVRAATGDGKSKTYLSWQDYL